MYLNLQIADILPDKFAIIFDGWTLDGQSSHFMGIFASFNHNNLSERVLLGFTTLGEEEEFTAEAHRDTLLGVLEIFGKNITNVVCLIGDNCNTNIAFAKLCEIPLVGIVTYIFNICLILFHFKCMQDVPLIDSIWKYSHFWNKIMMVY